MKFNIFKATESPKISFFHWFAVLRISCVSKPSQDSAHPSRVLPTSRFGNTMAVGAQATCCTVTGKEHDSNSGSWLGKTG